MADISSSKQRVARAAGIVMFAIFLSRVLDLCGNGLSLPFSAERGNRCLLCRVCNPGLNVSALVGGVISSAFIPVFTHYLAKGWMKQAWHAASSFINLTGTLLVMMTILGIIFTPILAPLVGIGFEGEQRVCW